MKVFKPALQDVDELVISIRIGRHQEKSRLEHKIPRIADNALDHLSVVEINPHPQALNDRRMFMKMKRPMPQVPIKRLYEKDGFGVLRRHILHGSRVQQPQPNRIQRILQVVAQKLLYRPKLTRLCKPADCMILVPNYNAMSVR
jgi:hypothetical protein